MANNQAIFIVDDDNDRLEKIRLLLHFVGKSTQVSNINNLQLDAINADQLLCIMIPADAPASLLVKLAEWNNYIPLLLIGVKEVPIHDANIQKQILGSFEMPPSNTTLLSLLHQCEICRFVQYQGQWDNELAGKFQNFVGISEAIQNIRQLIAQVAKVDSNVLITGESGTGKEVVARNLHLLSGRKEKPFVPVNCGAIPGELLESELFGHEKGAFTGAISTRQGRFELAQGGTLFLDEIGDMPLAMQVKLLRVLQERTFERVGSNKTIEANVRIIAATHRNLEQLVAEGKFREDLYYRLNVFPIEMPSLREREEDIPILINEIIHRFEKLGDGSVRLSPASMVSLSKHHWPGNIRELFNLIERLIILHPFGVVEVDQLPPKYRYDAVDGQSELPDLAKPITNVPQFNESPGHLAITEDDFDLKEHLLKLELAYIKDALEKSNWVVARAANLLGMRRTTLVEKMRKFQLSKNTHSTNE